MARTYGPAAEAALTRALRDIADGHITLHVSIDRYDPHTGQRIPPRVGQTWADRAVSMTVPDAAGQWWQTLADRDWIRLPVEGEAPVWHVTPFGRAWLAEHQPRERG